MCANCHRNIAISSGAALPAWNSGRNAPMTCASRRRNGRRFSGASVSGIATSITTALTSASSAAATNGALGPHSENSPPSAGPMMKPRPNAAPISAKVPPRLSGGVTSAITDPAGP